MLANMSDQHVGQHVARFAAAFTIKDFSIEFIRGCSMYSQKVLENTFIEPL